jgi:hypothetical protein
MVQFNYSAMLSLPATMYNKKKPRNCLAFIEQGIFYRLLFVINKYLCNYQYALCFI